MVFKRVFSKESNQSMLKSLLEAILKVNITNLKVKNPELVPYFKGEKTGQLDIKIEVEDRVATRYVEYHYIELPKFMKKLKKTPNTKLEKWLCLIIGKEEKIDIETIIKCTRAYQR